MLELEIEIKFNYFIQPICLWESFYQPSVPSGIIVGYGKSEDESKGHENVPKVLNVPLIDQVRCFLNNPSLAGISSDRTFCAGSADGTGACLGDSGGGLIVKFSNAFYLRGIVSSSLRKGQSCDVNTYSVYTDVLKYKNWIKTLIPDKEEEECGIMSSPSGLIQKGKNLVLTKLKLTNYF
jgi:secreted trypsin-like serine protease